MVLPRWSETALRDIAFEDYQVWITGLSVDSSTKRPGKGLSASRVIQAHQVVAAVMKFAIRTERLGKDPTAGVELPDKIDGEQRYLTHAQLHSLAVAAGRFRTLVFVLGYCGLRIGEASALRIRDIDIEARRITVRRSVTYVTGQGMVEGTTKNKTVRTVPVPAFLAPLLETEIGDRGPGELVFPPRRGDYLGPGSCGGHSTRGHRDRRAGAQAARTAPPARPWRSPAARTSRWFSAYSATRPRR